MRIYEIRDLLLGCELFSQMSQKRFIIEQNGSFFLIGLTREKASGENEKKCPEPKPRDEGQVSGRWAQTFD